MVVDPLQSSQASIKAAMASLVLPPVGTASSPLMARLQRADAGPPGERDEFLFSHHPAVRALTSAAMSISWSWCQHPTVRRELSTR